MRQSGDGSLGRLHQVGSTGVIRLDDFDIRHGRDRVRPFNVEARFPDPIP